MNSTDLPVIISSAYGVYKGDYKTLAADYYVVKFLGYCRS